MDGSALPLIVLAAFAVIAVLFVLLARRRTRAALTAEPASRPDSLPVARPTSDAGRLVARAEAAVNRIRDLARSPGDPWLRDHVSEVDAQSTEALGSLRILAGRVTVVEQTLARSDPARLVAEEERLNSALQTAPDDGAREAVESSLQAVSEQRATLDRLSNLRQSLLARMEPVSLGLEGVATRMGEVVALGSGDLGGGEAATAVVELNAQLDSLRTGLQLAIGMAEGQPPPTV